MCPHCEIEDLESEINPLGGLENLGSCPKHIFWGVQASIPWSVEEGRACNWKVYELCSYVHCFCTPPCFGSTMDTDMLWYASSSAQYSEISFCKKECIRGIFWDKPKLNNIKDSCCLACSSPCDESRSVHNRALDPPVGNGRNHRDPSWKIWFNISRLLGSSKKRCFLNMFQGRCMAMVQNWIARVCQAMEAHILSWFDIQISTWIPGDVGSTCCATNLVLQSTIRVRQRRHGNWGVPLLRHALLEILRVFWLLDWVMGVLLGYMLKTADLLEWLGGLKSKVSTPVWKMSFPFKQVIFSGSMLVFGGVL